MQCPLFVADKSKHFVLTTSRRVSWLALASTARNSATSAPMPSSPQNMRYQASPHPRNRPWAVRRRSLLRLAATDAHQAGQDQRPMVAAQRGGPLRARPCAPKTSATYGFPLIPTISTRSGSFNGWTFARTHTHVVQSRSQRHRSLERRSWAARLSAHPVGHQSPTTRFNRLKEDTYRAPAVAAAGPGIAATAVHRPNVMDFQASSGHPWTRARSTIAAALMVTRLSRRRDGEVLSTKHPRKRRRQHPWPRPPQ